MFQKLTFLLVFALPFTKALTVNIKFPLKIYEIVLVFAGALLALQGHVRVAPHLRKERKLLTWFIAVALFIVVLKILVPVKGISTAGFEFRFGPVGDSVFKFLYLLLDSLCYLLVSLYAFRNERRLLKFWLIGACAASVYSWYLFGSSLLGTVPFSLPGLDRFQFFSFFTFSFIRSGTFEEGNFLGLYLLVSVAIALHQRNFKIALFLSATALITFSTINVIGLVFLWGWFLWDMLKKNNYKICLCRFALSIAIFLAVTIMLISTGYVRAVLVSKLIGSNGDALSKLDRFNQSATGFKMFLANPISGVGLSRYGYYFSQCKFMNVPIKHDIKMIPNNVYIELLAELGILGFTSFILFIFRIYRTTAFAKLNSLRYGFICIMLVFWAFPTYSLMFLWAYLGVISGIYAKTIQKQKELLYSPV